MAASYTTPGDVTRGAVIASEWPLRLAPVMSEAAWRQAIILSRPPSHILQPFVSLLWATDEAISLEPQAGRERMLPTGVMHLAIRLGNCPVRLFADPGDKEGLVVGTAVLGGVRTAPFIKGVAGRTPSVGAMLRPGVHDPVSNAPAGALRGRHISLDDLWPASTIAELRERLEIAPSAAHRLAVFEHFLAVRVPAMRRIDPLVKHALFRLNAGMAVGQLIAETGFSHRHVVRVFSEAVGATPMVYKRLRRFSLTIQRLHAKDDASLADVASVLGYADQAHMNREFRDFAGLTPGQFLQVRSRSPHHLPLAP